MEERCFIFLLFTLLHLPHTTDLCLYNSCHCGEVSPPNVYVSLGSTLELNCTIEKDDSPFSLMFIFNQKEVHPPESIRIQNNSIVLRKLIQSVEEGGDYSCYKNDRKVGSSTVEVEYPLQEVNESDFACELFDWDKYLSCSWKIGTYKRESNIDVAIVAETERDPFMPENIDRNHPALLPTQMNNTYAYWNASLGEPYTIKFHLTITQTRTNKTLRQTLPKKVRDIVKPAPISKIFAESISSTSLTLKWENSHPDRFQIYNIFSSNEWTSDNFSKNLPKIKDRIQEMNFTDLIPFTNYNFTITRRPFTKKGANSYVQNGHWSSPTSETIRTLPDEPVSPPIIIEGSFSHVGEHQVVFYWKDTKLDWKTSTQNNTTLSVQHVLNFKVGVSCSANLSHSSVEESIVVGGGMFWSSCKYPEEKEPALPSSLTLTPDRAALDVTWTLVCDGLYSYPQWFNLTWCDLHSSREVCQDEDYVLLDPREKYYRLEDLDPSRTYRVRINSVSKDNHVRTNMDYKHQKPEIYEYIEDNAANLILLLAIIPSIITVVIGLIYIVKKCKSEKDVAVEVPFVTYKDAKEDVSYNTKNKQSLELTDKMDYKIVDGSQFSDMEKDSTGTRINDIELGLKDEKEPEVDSTVAPVLSGHFWDNDKMAA